MGEWTHVRVSRSTLAMLETTRASMEVADVQGRRELVRDPRGRVSLSQVIAELVYFRLKHHARVRRSNARRRERIQHAKEGQTGLQPGLAES